MPSLHAPAPNVLAYRAPTRRTRTRLEAFPIRQWLLVSDGLWLTHDGTMLLLCPTDPVLASNMGNGVETSPQEVGTR